MNGGPLRAGSGRWQARLVNPALLLDEVLAPAFGRALARALGLPTFECPVERGGPTTLIKRMAWYVDAGRIARVWYPVFPPDKNADVVLAWLDGEGRP